MRLTWKTWGCLGGACIVLAVLCQLYAQRSLVSLPNLELLAIEHDDEAERTGSNGWHEDLSQPAMRHSFIPWPRTRNPLLEPARRIGLAELKEADAETMLGLALLGPPESYEEQMAGLFRSGPYEKAAAYYFKLADLAMSRCEDEGTRQRLRRASLLAEVQWGQELFARYRWPGRSGSRSPTSVGLASATASAPASRPSGAAALEFMESEADAIDPSNAVHVYSQAVRIAQKLVRLDDDTDGGEARNAPADLVLVDEAQLLAGAHRLDGLLTRAERDCTFQLYWPLHRRIIEKGMLFYWRGRLPEECIRHNAALKTAWPALQPSRDLARRLCLLGDVLADKGHDALARAMYRHVSLFGEQVMFSEASNVPVIQALVGIGIRDLGVEHLTRYWAARGNDEMVMRLRRFSLEMTGRLNRAGAKWGHRGMDLFGHNEGAFQRYFRSCGLTWWFGAAGAVLFLVSLLAAVVYVSVRRYRHVGESPLRLSRRMLLAGMALPVALMLWLGALAPIRLVNYADAGGALLWGYVLLGMWLGVAQK